jgi:hypothetical protein
MKKILAIILMSIGMVSAAMAADFQLIGTKGVAAVVDYSYSRNIDTQPLSAAHVGVTGLQFDLGKLGSLAVEGGDTQLVNGGDHSNFATFEATYMNSVVTVGKLIVSGAAIYSAATGDKWLPWGQNSAGPTHSLAGDADFAYVLSPRISLIADYIHTITWIPQAPSSNSDTALGSVELTLTKKLDLTVGGGHTFAQPSGSWGVYTDISYQF